MDYQYLFIVLLLIMIFITYFYLVNIESFSPKSEKYKKKIPKVIYKSGKRRLVQLPKSVKDLFQKTKEDNPDFEVKYYSDNESRKFIEKNCNKDILWAYDKLVPGSYKADLFRYCILYKNGGIWSDLSDQFLVPIDQIIDFEKDQIVLAKDKFTENGHEIKNRGIQIAFIATIPKNKIFLDAINEIVTNCKTNSYQDNPLSVTGPFLFGKICEKHKFLNKIKLLDFDGNHYYDKNNKQVIKWKSLKTDLNTILKRTNREHYSYLWNNRNIYNNI